ncbi:hypothetical protein LJR219_004372 [Phenylobacterium sp. LjRoot219]|uniref:hypothetical protein n=1 Tax=Phenylobacterium sp. LjRoot219 TaxID=3342283 RepID=UPI003ECD4FB7
MNIVTANSVRHEAGPLTQIVNQFCAAQAKAISDAAYSPIDWRPVAEFIEVSEFRRIGAYLEELDWPKYQTFLTGWISGGTRFEMTIFNMTEVGNAVFQEIEERHYRGEDFIRKNVIAVYRFNERRRIIHLDIYEQARDSGQWIVEAARAAGS